MKSDQSVPLSQAMQHFSEQSDWQELVSGERYAMKIIVLGGPETEDERRHWRYHQLKGRLETELLTKLTAGSLQASGFIWPIGLNAKRRVIPAERWHNLEPDFAASEATGGGLRIVDILVQASKPARVRSSPPSAADQHVPREHVSLAKLRNDLRRWLQRQARARGTSWQKKHYRSAAGTRFGERVTDNLFNEVWRSADLPDALRRPGLRKTERLSTDLSPEV